MRRLLLLVAVGAAALMSVGVASAQPDNWKISLSVTPSTVLVDQTASGSGRLTDLAGTPVPGQDVTISAWANNACSGTPIDSLVKSTDANGAYDFGVTFFVGGIYSFASEATGPGPGEHALSSCVVVNVVESLAAAGPRGPDSTFLCYSRYPDSIPGVFTFATAGQLLKDNPWSGPDLLTGGYSIPIAVAGTIPFGTNVGGYHLVCNPGSLKPLGTYTNSGGDPISSAVAASIRATWQSDLNLFPVYG
jgi:hypothetical protein